MKQNKFGFRIFNKFKKNIYLINKMFGLLIWLAKIKDENLKDKLFFISIGIFVLCFFILILSTNKNLFPYLQNVSDTVENEKVKRNQTIFYSILVPILAISLVF